MKGYMKGYRTILINILSAVASILEVSDITNYLNDTQALYFMVGLAVINIALRLITTTPVGLSEPLIDEYKDVH